MNEITPRGIGRRSKEQDTLRVIFGLFPGVVGLITDVSEHCICLHTSYPLGYTDGTVFRNVGYYTPHSGEQPERLHATFRTRQNLEIKNKTHNCN
jgi:hypothetical protein